jgi:hypothetical protein
MVRDPCYGGEENGWPHLPQKRPVIAVGDSSNQVTKFYYRLVSFLHFCLINFWTVNEKRRVMFVSP